MDHLFTGAARQRPTINLGGTRTLQSDHSDLVARARHERLQREHDRAKHKAVHAIQAFWRGRSSANRTRHALRAQFDPLVAPSASPSPADVVLASRLLAVFFVQGNSADVKRAGAWCRTVLKPAGNGDKTPLLFSLFTTPSWSTLVRCIGSSVLFATAAAQPSLPQAPLFLEITKILSDPASYVKYKAAGGTDKAGVPGLLAAVLEDGLFSKLRLLLLAIPPENRSHPCLPAAINLSLLPFKAFPPSTPSPSAPASRSATAPTSSPERTRIVLAFAANLLSVPLLPARLAIKEATLLAASLPFFDTLHALVDASTVLPSDPEAAAYFLANVVTLGQDRVKEIKDGKTLRAYLAVCGALLERFPPGVLTPTAEAEEDVKGKGKAVEEIVLDDSDDEEEEAAVRSARAAVGTDASSDAPMASSAPSTSKRLILPPATLSALSHLSSRAHLSLLLALSTRYSSTTRPALASYFAALLGLLPATTRTETLNTLLYSASGQGLIRELFRGYLRSGALGRYLASAGRSDASAVLAALGDAKYAGKDGNEWAVLVLVLELYSRCLVTLGDDEFYTSSSSASSAPGGGADNATRNPLSLDEVVTLSAMARNAAFALYWLAGPEQGQAGGEGGGAGEGVLGKKVVGTSWTYEQLRGLLTTFLQQVHARDSRRQFTPDGHWHMTSQFDLQSFIQTAVYEEERLSAESSSTSDGSAAPGPMDVDSADEDEEESFGRRRRPQPYVRRGPAREHRQTVLSKRQMALVSPRLGVLNNIPFVIPFETRVAIFRQFVASDYQKLGLDPNGLIQRSRHRAVIRRSHVAEDAYAHLNGLGNELKKRIEIVFIDEHGMEEAGIDGGGLQKELMTALWKEVFDTNRGLWLATTTAQELYPNPHAYAKESTQLSWYQFIGRILGKALYQGILVNVRFADFFLAKWLGRQSYLDDLASLDPELYRGLIKLKTYPGNVEEDLSLNFTITEEDFGISRTIDLIPGGSDIPVTNDNRMQYIVLVSHYRLNVQIAPQCRAFFAGLSEVISPRWLRMFNQSELAVLVGGTDQPVDIDDLRRNTVYSGWSADENTPTIRLFWETLASFSAEDRAALVRFVTACERPPLLGFGQLNPLFAIRKAGDDQERLPTSATCVNLLKLPEYTDANSLREKLLYAIRSGAGFDLS
ncbi:hypothetical protein JCM10207_003234 [Rhodosporidiobolus poonsookiae]